MRIPTRCECGRLFEAEAESAGGHVNCPGCGKAALVPGLRDPLWRILQGVGFLAVTGLGVLAYDKGGPLAAVAAGAVGLGLLWLISRGF